MTLRCEVCNCKISAGRWCSDGCEWLWYKADSELRTDPGAITRRARVAPAYVKSNGVRLRFSQKTQDGIGRGAHKLTPANRREVVLRYEGGESSLSLAKAFGVSRAYIYVLKDDPRYGRIQVSATPFI